MLYDISFTAPANIIETTSVTDKQCCIKVLITRKELQRKDKRKVMRSDENEYMIIITMAYYETFSLIAFPYR